jgi:serine protease Do
MKHLLRPFSTIYLETHRILPAVLLAAGVGLALAAQAARAQSSPIVQFLEDPIPLLTHSGTPGYLGVYITDVDTDKAQSLKLKEVRGAVITLIDHDAPAGQIGLKINDVVLALNGQSVQDAEQLRKMLRDIPPGRKISLEISRDGNIQTVAVQLADRKTIDHDAMKRIDNNDDDSGHAPSMGIFAGGGDPPLGGGFHLPFFGSTLKVGALVEPLTSQMADYLGVAGGLMVKQVTRKSEAAVAGFRAFDVILKVGADTIDTPAAWERALRSNEGKPVQVTILRDKKQQTLTLQVDSKRHQSALEPWSLFASQKLCPAA